MNKDQKRTWLVILYLIFLVMLLKYAPKAGYGVAAITLLALLFRLKGK